MYLKAESGGIPWRPAKIVDGYRIKPLVLSDSAYPSTTWQVKPYNFNINLTESQKAFNKNLSSAWVTVVRAFGVLKGHWRCLLKRLDNRLINVSDIIITCCTLHNICQERSDRQERVYRQEDNIVNNILDHGRRQRDSEHGNFQKWREAEVLREVLTIYVINNM